MNKVHVVNKVVSSLLIGFFCASVSAQVALKNDHPSEYLVKKGDTLWDIAGVFLKSPWLWTSIWEKNAQIKNPHLIYPKDVIYLVYRDGQPYLSKSKPSSNKVSPKVRTVNKFTPITAIPKIALQAFVSSHRIVDSARVDKMPYILAGSGMRELIGKGDEVFVRGVLDPDFNHYHIYRIGKTFGAEQGFPTSNTEIIKVGTLDLLDKQGDISRGIVSQSKGLVKKGDIIVRAQNLSLQPLYYLAAAPSDVSGKIIAAVNEKFQIARYDGVVLNLGLDAGITPGHVFNIIKAPVEVVDPKTKELVTISNQISGKLMVVNVFENLSYGIVLSATNAILPGDTINMLN
ncbi:MAG: LysM peptidoglycan-binding domain-containing protein [Oceanospirillaceae bacterium]|nr:LysM peptidoglycan-binding domain-containing protein [Oceanospirillaceae bacterium]